MSTPIRPDSLALAQEICESRPFMFPRVVELLMNHDRQRDAQAAELVAGLRWAIRQLQGESGASHSYWVEIPEYQAALKVLTKIEEAEL